MATLLDESIAGGRGLGIGGGEGFGLGGGLLLGLLLGRGALGGFGAPGGEAATLVNMATKDDIMQQTLGDIKASIPFNEAQVQLALAQAVAQLTNQNNANTQALQAGQTAAALTASTNTALLTRDIGAVDTNVDRQSTAIQIAISADGEKTRALITNNQIAELNQRLTVAQLENAENRAIQREQNNSHNMTVTVNQAQAQQQLQAQRQEFTLNTLLNCFSQLAGQVARATNSNVIVGNTGASTTGAQTANPTNVVA